MTRHGSMRPAARPGGRKARPRDHAPRLTAPALLQMSGQPEQLQCQPVKSCGPAPSARGFSPRTPALIRVHPQKSGNKDLKFRMQPPKAKSAASPRPSQNQSTADWQSLPCCLTRPAATRSCFRKRTGRRGEGRGEGGLPFLHRFWIAFEAGMRLNLRLPCNAIVSFSWACCC